MSFSNACFISYRHLHAPNAEKIVKAFHEALEGSVAWWLPKRPVYLDERRLRGGDFLDPELAANLCSSACMVLLFSPYYFDMQSMYCAREYKAMLELEAKRLQLLPQSFGERKGLIIPVVMRGEQYLPAEIAARTPYQFDRVLLRPADFETRSVLEQMDAIAHDIYDRYEVFRQAGADPSEMCGDFQFPGEEAISAWLSAIVSPPQGMPGRDGRG
jgi:TIR domain